MTVFAGQLVDVMASLTSPHNWDWNKPFRDAVQGKQFDKAGLVVTAGKAVLVLTGPGSVRVTTTITLRATGTVETGIPLVVS